MFKQSSAPISVPVSLYFPCTANYYIKRVDCSHIILQIYRSLNMKTLTSCKNPAKINFYKLLTNFFFLLLAWKYLFMKMDHYLCIQVFPLVFWILLLPLYLFINFFWISSDSAWTPGANDREGLGSSYQDTKMAAFRLLLNGSLLRPKFARKTAHLCYLSRFFKTKSESLIYSENGDPEKVLRWDVTYRVLHDSDSSKI